MKRYISLILCIALIFSSTSFIFGVDWSTSDQTNLSNAASRLYYNGYSAAYYLKQIADRVAILSTISSDISTIKSYLFDDGHSVGYWISAISSWMSPIYTSITNSVSSTDIEPIISGLNEVISSGGSTSYVPYLKYNGKSNANYLYDLNSYLDINWGTGIWDSNYRYQIYMPNNSNGTAYLYNMQLHKGSYFKDLFTAIMATDNASNLFNSMIVGYFNSSQNAVNWGNLGTSSFTPTSMANGIYSWLSAIQAPVARLSYVLASDERIAAQAAAAPVEQAVVDDFIEPTGDASASTNDIGSIADLSSGYKQNFSSTASVTGIFDIFNSNNFGWFSSETAQQLDTTVQNRGSSFATPLLDQQLEDIYNDLGVTNAN